MRKNRVLTLLPVIGTTLILVWGGLIAQGVAGGYGGGGMGGGGRETGGNSGGGGAGHATLAFDPSSLTVAQGETANAKVTVALAAGRTWGASLKVMDAPMGTTITFSPASGNPPFSSTMSIHAAPTAAVGTYMVKVEATGGDQPSVTSFQVTVTKSSSRGY